MCKKVITFIAGLAVRSKSKVTLVRVINQVWISWYLDLISLGAQNCLCWIIMMLQSCRL